MTTISLPLAIWGDGYAQFLPRWWEGVLALERQPDEVVIVADSKNYLAVIDSIPRTDIHVVTDHFYGEGYAQFWNWAIALSKMEWVAICNVDDQFLPAALNDIDTACEQGFNLICDSIQDKDNGNITQSHWVPETMGSHWPMVGAEPMRRSLWEAAGGFREQQLFADWALAMDMVASGEVKAYDTSTVRCMYDRGYDRVTLSGALADGNSKAQGYQALRQLAQELGLN